jgi:hypothetical protein
MDTVIKIIRTILTHPNEPKYRKMKWANKRFAETVKGAPGATDFLKKIGFVDDQREQALILKRVDEGVLLVAMQMLEKQRNSDGYQAEVEKLEFETVIQALLGRSPDAVEAAKRQQYAARVPNLPEEKVGSQTKLRITMGSQTIERRFRTDNTLNAVIDYMGSRSSLLPQKILSGEWTLMNTTTFPEQPIDLSLDRTRTFTVLELWPSGELTVRPNR